MSRGERFAVGGAQNLSSSMRQNYDEHGVDEYYKKVGATYRNPHYPGIRSCLFAWFNKWLEFDEFNSVAGLAAVPRSQTFLFDMACGSGEATEALKEWFTSGRAQWKIENMDQSKTSIVASNAQQIVVQPPMPASRRKLRPRAIHPSFPQPLVAAADPYTADAYNARTSYPCSTLSFRDIAEGALPSTSTKIASGEQTTLHRAGVDEDQCPMTTPDDTVPLIEVVICSFALHLIQSPSEVFTLLWELSTKARWLIILAPHKKPEIKDGWGWTKWDITSWAEAPMHGSTGELLNDRVHCRAYRSTHFS